MVGLSGSRGDVDDPLLQLSTPTLFVVGQHATMCSQDNIEDFRERVASDNSLLMVGGADDVLRMDKKHKKKTVNTQTMVDRAIQVRIEKKSFRHWFWYSGEHL